jgi:hypothetical protein
MLQNTYIIIASIAWAAKNGDISYSLKKDYLNVI